MMEKVILSAASSIRGEFHRDWNETFQSKSDAHRRLHEIDEELTGGERLHFREIYSVIRCSCGQEVTCRSFTNTCSCGADYNFSGTRLADRSQWGEETGEHWSECL